MNDQGLPPLPRRVPPHRVLAAVAALLRHLDSEPTVIGGARALRRLLPGDSEFGDPLSVAGAQAPQQIGQRLAAATERRPGVLREMGLSALQVWQALGDLQGRIRETGGDGEEAPVAILFTDLVGFSTWALKAGDEVAVELLRAVAVAVEPLIAARGGRVVKRLGDGLMAAFDETGQAVEAALDACDAVAALRVNRYRPRLRAGVHVGTPRRLGGDYFGVDVNVAARVAQAASGDEVLISEAAQQQLDATGLAVRRHLWFRAKGAPRNLRVYVVQRSAR
jgi:adenylate cyclase